MNAYNLSVCELMLTEKMPMMLAEYEKLPAAGKSDQFLAGGCLSHPSRLLQWPEATDRWQQCTTPFKALLLTNNPHNKSTF